MAKITIKKNDDGKVSISTLPQAMTASYYATSAGERSDFAAPLFKFASSLMRVTAIGRCETAEEAKHVLGEALLWYFFQEFLYSHEARNNFDAKTKITCAYTTSQWSHRGSDTDFGQLTDALERIRVKSAAFTDACVRFCATADNMREKTGPLLILHPARAIAHDKGEEDADLRTVMSYFKWSPRECLEAAVNTRISILEKMHDEVAAASKAAKAKKKA